MNEYIASDHEGVSSRTENNHLLYLKQKELLETFLEKGAISRAQYEKSLHDLTEKMGEEGSYE